MAKTTKRKKGNHGGETIAEKNQRETRQKLQRSVRAAKQIHTLARALSRALAQSDAAITGLAVELADRAVKLDTTTREPEQAYESARP